MYDVMNASIFSRVSSAESGGVLLDVPGVCEDSVESSGSASGVPRPAQTYAAAIAATARTATAAIRPRLSDLAQEARAGGRMGAGVTAGRTPVPS